MDLSQWTMHNTQFVGCQFRGATLAGTDLTGSAFVDCDLSVATVSDAVVPDETE